MDFLIGKNQRSQLELICLILFLSGVYSLYFILEWSVAHDVAILNYDGWLYLQGKVPYKEFLEYNTPTSIFLYATQIALFGIEKTGWLISLLAWYTFGFAGIFYLLRRTTLLTKVIASLLFLIFEVSCGHWIAGQRDFIAGVFALWAVALSVDLIHSLSSSPRVSTYRIFFIGIAWGFAIAIRPHLFVLPVILHFGVGRSIIRSQYDLGVLLASMSLPTIAALCYLAILGGFSSYFDLVFHFQLPIYPLLGRIDPIKLFDIAAARAFPAILIFLCGNEFSKRYPIEFRAAACTCIGGFIAYLLQGKGWHYQLSSAVPFFAVLVALQIESICNERLSVFGTLFAAMLLWYYSPLMTLHASRLRPIGRAVVESLSSDITSYGPSATVQPLDLTGGVLHAMLLAQKAPSTRFIYDVFFYNEVTSPFSVNARTEFIETIRQHPPSLVVLSAQSWPNRTLGFNRLNRFLELRKFLEDRYVVCTQNEDYWLYALPEETRNRSCKSTKYLHEKFFKTSLTEAGSRLLLLNTEDVKP